MLSNEKPLDEKFVIQMCEVCENEHKCNHYIVIVDPDVGRETEVLRV